MIAISHCQLTRGAAFAALLFLVACAPNSTPLYVLDGEVMGTTYVIKIRDSDGIDNFEHFAMVRAAKAAQELTKVDLQMSTYREGSNVSVFNQPHVWKQAFQPETFAVISLAQQVSEQTGGAFDITVAPIVNLYGFGPEEANLDEETLEEKRKLVGFKLLALHPESNQVEKQRSGVTIDLSAIAKGYAVDLAAEVLEAGGIQNYMVELGGEVRARGTNERLGPWQIAIEKPLEEQRQIQIAVPLDNIAMATSGDYRNYYLYNGKRFSHTIDPRTGRPADNGLASATVLHESCVLADAYATALMVLGPRESINFAEQHKLAIYLIIRENEDSFTTYASHEFERRLEAKEH